MKISTAILKGCRGTVKIKHGLYAGDPLAPTGCCVMGAAALGRCGNAMKAGEVCDVLGEQLYAECVYRNNDTDATRESIAAWLADLGF